jgi:hypothetical protein
MQAIRAVEECSLLDESDELEQCKLLVDLYVNMAVVNLKLENHKQMLNFAEQALYKDRANIRALYLKGKVSIVSWVTCDNVSLVYSLFCTTQRSWMSRCCYARFLYRP